MTLNREFLDTYFEENVTSALFPLYAERLLETNDVDRANEICSEGVEQFPHLATGWLIYAQVAMAEEKYADAKTYLFRALEEDRACLLAAELLLNTEAIDLSEQEQTDSIAVLLNMDSEYETALESLEEISAGEDEGEFVEEPELDKPVEAATEDIGEIAEESEEITEEEPLTETEEDVFEDLDFDEEEDPVGEYLDEEETPDTEVDDLPAQEGEENEFLEEVFHEAEEESDFLRPDFEGEMLDDEVTAEDFEEDFDLEALQESEEFEQPTESEELPPAESVEEENEALSEEYLDEDTEEAEAEAEETRPIKEDLKRTNVDFAEIANQDSERAPEAIEGFGLSRDLIESMSQEELLSVLKKKYGLEEESESSTAFLNRLQEIEDVDDDVKEALQQFDIFKIEDTGKSENEPPSAEEEDLGESEDLGTPGEADVLPEDAEDEIEQKIAGDEEIDLDDLGLELEEDTEDADVDFGEAADEIDEFEDLEDESEIAAEPQEEEALEQDEEPVQATEEQEESDEEVSVEVPIEKPLEEHISDHVQPRHKPSNEAKLTITPRMATFTFADVLRKQGLYEQAYEVLEMMRDKSSNIERIEREQEKLRDLMNSPDDA